MMYLHKILPALFLPIGIMLIVLAAALVTKRRGFIAAGLALLLVFSMPLVSNILFRSIENFAARPVIATLPNGDTIVVLSGMLTTAPLARGGTVSEWTEPDRFFAGVELLKAGKAPPAHIYRRPASLAAQ